MTDGMMLSMLFLTAQGAALAWWILHTRPQPDHHSASSPMRWVFEALGQNHIAAKQPFETRASRRLRRAHSELRVHLRQVHDRSSEISEKLERIASLSCESECALARIETEYARAKSDILELELMLAGVETFRPSVVRVLAPRQTPSRDQQATRPMFQDQASA